ncbi:DNA topoisomerase IB [Lentzea flava]|uniref:DNA topoisomerase n=1 Tax=Lentzea flava TaxID=103732 RepID=A0ABQ2UXH1_9PSEU|nr:DNA topoisomerase IB [Lentzea flava]MCP2202109.1 DNA topoisomerase IB [Lentzea flava]GGU57055.1 DNA topoisomerase [Lentzea flava]
MRLRRSDPAGPGWTRRRHGSGFRYLDATGQRLAPEDVARVKALVIPPAWREVWISPHPNGHIQAVGYDDAGRRQYLYHEKWRTDRDAEKFDRVLKLAPRLKRFREQIEKDMRSRGRTRLLAIALRMLDLGVFRVGHEEYAEENGTHGVATLLCEHLSVRGDRVRFRFPAKHGVEVDEEITDPVLARAVRGLLKDKTPDCRVFDLTADDVNERFRELVGDEFSVKDLRTWHATVHAAQAFAAALGERGKPTKRAISAVMKEVAEHLGNTAAVARKSYVDPRLIEAFERGEVIGKGDPERAVRKLLTKS